MNSNNGSTGNTKKKNIQINCNIMGETLCYYQKAVLCGDAEKMLNLENCFIGIAREAMFECIGLYLRTIGCDFGCSRYFMIKSV